MLHLLSSYRDFVSARATQMHFFAAIEAAWITFHMDNNRNLPAGTAFRNPGASRRAQQVNSWKRSPL
jgi:hypothetical protein